MLTELSERSHRLDAIALLVVPVVVVSVFLLPDAVKRAFVFEYTDPSLVTAFTSAYVHLAWRHLLVNVAAYLLVVPTAFALSVLCGRRQQFYIAFVTFTLAFPVVLALLNLVEPRTAVGFGLSGVVMAFVGFVPLALGTYLEDRLAVGPAAVVTPTVFCFGLALIAALSLRSVLGNETALLATAGLGVPVLGSTLLSARNTGRQNVEERSPDAAGQIRAALSEPGYAELAVVACCLLLAMPFVAFPANTTVDGGSVNLYVHLLGYVLGFTIPYTAAAVTGWGRDGSRRIVSEPSDLAHTATQDR
jgi:hypothetical protein